MTLNIVWAVDPLDEQNKLEFEASALFAQLRTTTSIKIQPVYIFRPDAFGISLDDVPNWRDTHLPAAKNALKQRFKYLSIPELAEPMVIAYPESTLTGAVSSLIDYAETSHGDLIVVGSHGRRGVERALVGSFAEEVMLQSTLPLIVIGTNVEAAARVAPVPRLGRACVQNILFATDFGEGSDAAFEKLVDLAKILSSRITLLHAMPGKDASVESGVYLLSGGWMQMPTLQREQQKAQELALERWSKLAQDRSVTFDSLIDVDSSDVADSIVSHAEKIHAGIIAITGRSGRTRSAILGSVSRRVVRVAPCPVWIVRETDELEST